VNFIRIEDETCELLDGESVLTNYPFYLLKNTEAREGCKNKKIKIKKATTSQEFLVEG